MSREPTNPTHVWFKYRANPNSIMFRLNMQIHDVLSTSSSWLLKCLIVCKLKCRYVVPNTPISVTTKWKNSLTWIFKNPIFSTSFREAMMHTGAMFGRQSTGIGWLIADCNSDTSLPNPLWSVSLIDRWKAFICTVNLKQQSQNKNIRTQKQLHFSIQGHVNQSISFCDLSRSDLAAEKPLLQYTTGGPQNMYFTTYPFKLQSLHSQTALLVLLAN